MRYSQERMQFLKEIANLPNMVQFGCCLLFILIEFLIFILLYMNQKRALVYRMLEGIFVYIMQILIQTFLAVLFMNPFLEKIAPFLPVIPAIWYFGICIFGKRGLIEKWKQKQEIL